MLVLLPFYRPGIPNLQFVSSYNQLLSGLLSCSAPTPFLL